MGNNVKVEGKEKLLNFILSNNFWMYWIVKYYEGDKWVTIVDAEHWQFVESAIDYLKTLINAGASSDNDIDKALVNWMHFSLANFGIDNVGKIERKYIGDKLLRVLCADTEAELHSQNEDDIEELNKTLTDLKEMFGDEYDQDCLTIENIENLRSMETLEHHDSPRVVSLKKNKFFAYYAVTILCFDDNRQEKETDELKENELFDGFFEDNINAKIIMSELFQYHPPMNEIYGNKIGGLTQDRIDRVKRAAQNDLLDCG